MSTAITSFLSYHYCQIELEFPLARYETLCRLP